MGIKGEYLSCIFIQDTLGAEESVLISEVSWLQGLKSTPTWYLGQQSALWYYMYILTHAAIYWPISGYAIKHIY